MELGVKNYVFLITYTLLMLCLIMNFSVIMGIFSKITMLLMPFVYGFIIAYVINWPYEFIKEKVSKYIVNKKSANLVCIVLSYLIVFGVFAFIFITIIPRIYGSLVQFMDNFSQYTQSFVSMAKNLEKKLKLDQLTYNYLDTIIKNLPGLLERSAQGFFSNMFNFTKNFAIGIYNWIIGIIISFYFIASKDKLICQLKLLISVYIPPRFSESVLKVLRLTHVKFGKFLIGKIIDSLIIGMLCFLGTSILQTPYTLLISVIVAITNIIPFFGPFIGAVPCILILLVVSPLKAIWFTVFILILQQIDGNIIGPKILGNTVGISGLWIMFSVILGGGLFGIPGMIVGVPVFAVIYTMISEYVTNSYHCPKDSSK